MPIEDLKQGACVKLKSGGPVMTISGNDLESYTGKVMQDTFRCVWFQGTEMKSGSFHRSTLARVSAVETDQEQ